MCSGRCMVTSEYSSPPTTRKAKYREKCARGRERWFPGRPSTPRTHEGSSGRECSGLCAAAPEHSVPRGSIQVCPGESAREVNSTPEHSVPRRQEWAFSGESARGGERRPPSTRYSDDPGSPLAVAPEGPTDEVSASQRPKAAFKERAWPVTSNCSRRAQRQFLPRSGRGAWGY